MNSVTYLSPSVVLCICLAALVTYGLRAGGLLLAERMPKSARFRRVMDALPGTILLSLVAPGILAAGAWGWVAALCTAICAYKTKNLFAAMVVGMGIVLIERQLL